MTDPFAPLKTYEDATPGPWGAQPHTAHESAVAVGVDIERWEVVAPTRHPDARHIATWDPETCREVVELLESVVSSGWAEELDHDMGWEDRLNALLERLATP